MRNKDILKRLKQIYKDRVEPEINEVEYSEESARANLEVYYEFKPYRDEANKLIEEE